MYNLTDVIKSGKSDWEKMQKKVLKEAFSPEQSGHTATPSDTSPNAEIQGGKFTTRDQYTSQMGQNIENLGNTPEYKEFRKNNDVVISKSEKHLIKETLKAANLNKDKGIPLSDQIDETIEEFENDKTDILNEINKNIKLYNELTRDIITQMGIGADAASREIPMIKSLNDFKNIMGTINTHLITSIMGNSSKLAEARGRTNVAAINQGSDIKKKDTIERINTWLQKQPERSKNLNLYLNNILTGIKKLEVFENIIEGLQKVSKFSKLGRKGAMATNAVKFKGLTPEDEKEIISDLNTVISGTEQTQEVAETVTPTTNVGPGKIYDPSAICEEKTETQDDIKTKNIQNLNESWKKYSLKKTPNKQKPDDFVILMG